MQRYDTAQLDSYWHDISARHAGASGDGLELVCYAGMPSWFNNLIHRYQQRAFRALTAGESFTGARVLDIGTGVGRWAAWYACWPGAAVHGIDIEARRLDQARARTPQATFGVMSADALEFPDATFDVVNCITVLQHTPDHVKHAAIREIGRVAAPSARLIVMELVDQSDDAAHVFPWPARAWERAFSEQGFTLVRRVGNEYIPLLRILKRAHRAIQGQTSPEQIAAIKRGRRSLKDRASLGLLHAAALASYPIEEVAIRTAPPSCARINGWLFTRERDA